MILAVYALLLAFGILYALAVWFADKNGYAEGYRAWLVIVGVLVTLAGVAVLSWQAAILTLGAFAASGAPMALADWLTHAAKRRSSQQAIRQEHQ